MAEPFFWGAGGKRVSSPEAAAKQRAIAEALIGRSETPAQNWAQGLADVAAAWSGTQLRNQADEAEQEGQRAVAELLAGLTPESGFSDISAVMANPWSTASQSAVAQALMGNQFNRSNIVDERAYQAGLLADQRAYDQPMRDLQLEGAGLANQTSQAQLDALLNPPPPAPIKVGDVLVDPVTFEPIFDARGEAGFTLSPGQQRFDASGQPIAGVEAAPDDLTSAIQNYQFLVSQGVDPTTAQDQAFGGGRTVVNVGDQGQRMGTVPPGYAVIDDPNNPSGFRLEPIPGGPVAADAEAAAAAQAAGQEVAGRTANVVREDIARIREIVKNSPWYNPAVGFGSGVAKALEGSNATNVAALSKTVLANIGFDRLQQMREASPTGGALGAISDRELGTLQSVMGNLEQSQSVDQFIYNLDRLGEIYDEISRKASAYPNAKGFGFEEVSGGQSQANPDVVDFLDYFR